MRDYELAFIIQPNIADDDVTGIVDKVSQITQNLNGEVVSTDVWGRRQLAYLIGRYREGVYVLQKIKLQPSAVSELEYSLKFMEEIIRHLVVKAED